MQVKINESMNTVEVWLSRAESEKYPDKRQLDLPFEEYAKRKLRVMIFRSGNQILFEKAKV